MRVYSQQLEQKEEARGELGRDGHCQFHRLGGVVLSQIHFLGKLPINKLKSINDS